MVVSCYATLSVGGRVLSANTTFFMVNRDYISCEEIVFYRVAGRVIYVYTRTVLMRCKNTGFLLAPVL